MPDQYWVTGSDGKEYGPAPLATLGQWITEGRVVPATRIRKEGGAVAEARSYPEFSGFFESRVGSGPPAAPSEFRVWGFMGQAWELVKPHWLPLAAIFFLQALLYAIPYLGACMQFIIGGAIEVGVWRALLATADGRKPSVGMMFEGFDRFGDAFLAFLVRAILVCLCLLLLIVPGIIVSLMWLFTFPVLGETNLGFWEAMKRSAVLTEGYRWRLFLLALACIPILLLGLLALCLGVFVAVPVCLTAFALAYRFLQQKKNASGRIA